MTRLRDETGFRLRAACVAINSACTHVLLVSAANRAGAWVLPAGGVEPGESAYESAKRELWEEAGAVVAADASSSEGLTSRPLFMLHDYKKRARTTFFAARVEEPISDAFPEAKKRVRRWVLLADAAAPASLDSLLSRES